MEKDARLSVAMELEYFISQVVLPLQLENVTVTYSAKGPSFSYDRQYNKHKGECPESRLHRTAINPGIDDA